MSEGVTFEQAMFIWLKAQTLPHSLRCKALAGDDEGSVGLGFVTEPAAPQWGKLV